MTVFIVVVVVAVVLAWLIGGTKRDCVAVLAAFGAALCVYALKGSPLRPAEPLSVRLAEIEARGTTEIEPEELIALRRVQALGNWRDPSLRTGLSEALLGAGRLEEAISGYRFALRIDPSYFPALRGLADAITLRRDGQVGEQAMKLYSAVLGIDPGDMRSGFMLGLGLWQSGELDAARARWDATRALLSDDDPAVERLVRLQRAIEAADR